MRDLILIVVMVLFCVFASFSTEAKTTTIKCTDSGETIQIYFDSTQSETIMVNNEPYVFMEGDSTGDTDRGWYRSHNGIIEVVFHLYNNKIQSMKAKGTAPNSTFKEGYCL